MTIKPEAEGGVFGKVSGLEWSQARGYQQHYRWQFKVSRCSNKAADQLYNGGLCRWTANPMNKQEELVNPLRVAVAIVHSGVPFLANVAIRGSLSSGWGRFRYIGQSQNVLPNRTILSPEPGNESIETDVETLQEEMAKANEARIPGEQLVEQMYRASIDSAQ